ncbi:hypothetical protein SSP35_03_03600 [Streptomyces sp. NBRC 110611]|uniref:hypothetical protein n=1 Tax=Streptomyces sp. NBRC 110611 TaxID=1621259 RepID=UPI00085708FD|nr:hypothetical protein [Streptomyces sp. NBRC 110611]GAU66712.1 hypothetical protein SSP35_03_03600 [Streptomyces sp. NBRC 110611]
MFPAPRRPGRCTDDTGRQTAETLAYLHGIRSAFRARKRKSAALMLYGIALVSAGWGIPLLVTAARAGGAYSGSAHSGGAQAGCVQGPLAASTACLPAALPVAVPTLTLLVALVMARGAVWRGPVLLDLPTLSWLLSTPLLRAPLLLPRLTSAALLAGLAGAGAGGVAGFLLSASGTEAWPVAVAAGAWAGVTTALTGTAAGALVERHDRFLARHGARLFRAAWGIAAALLAVTAVSAVRGLPSWLGQAYLWSGPWGWSAQPLVAAVGPQNTPAAPWWWAGAVLSAGCTAAALLLARRATPDISQDALRLRATTAARLGASLLALDLRQARAGIPTLRERGARPALRLPMPRRPWLLIPWRDATGLLRAPGRLVWAAVWTALAVVLTALAPDVHGNARSFAALGGLAAAYLAAAQLAEPARLESDDPRRSAGLRCTPGALALRHALVPAALLLAGLGAGAGVCLLGGWARPGTLVLIAAVPALVAAALVSAYRGSVPLSMLVGVTTPMGNTAPLQTTVWYLRGPLAALALTAPVAVGVAGGGAYGVPQLAWQLALGAGGLWWGRRTAHRLHRG